MAELTCKREAVFAGNLVLVNKAHPIRRVVRSDELLPVDEQHPSILLNRRARAMLARLLFAVGAQNKIVPVSGYRTRQEQARILEDSLHKNGKEFTYQYVALPNASEHQTGLAIDLGENKSVIDLIRPDFSCAISRTFSQRAADYGFVQRYPVGKEAVTGIACEPWHFRYVGYPHSAIMQQEGLALEEYIDYLRAFPERGEHLRFGMQDGRVQVYWVAFPDDEHEITITLPESVPYEVSGNNIDGLVVTLWR